VAELGVLQNLDKNYRAKNSCARACENVEFVQIYLILNVLMGYWVEPNIKKVSIEPKLTGWWFRP